MKYVFWIFLIITLNSCTSCEYPRTYPEETDGMKPVYLDESINPDSIYIADFTSVNNFGKIVYSDPYLYVNEKLIGIHLYDNTDPANPLKLSFIHIAGNIDFSVRYNIIYANNIYDLVTIELINTDSLVVRSRIEDFYEKIDIAPEVPSDYFGFFECVDEQQGLLLGWEFATLQNPKCYVSF